MGRGAHALRGKVVFVAQAFALVRTGVAQIDRPTQGPDPVQEGERKGMGCSLGKALDLGSPGLFGVGRAVSGREAFGPEALVGLDGLPSAVCVASFENPPRDDGHRRRLQNGPKGRRAPGGPGREALSPSGRRGTEGASGMQE
jgi:hypothetical protein